MLLCHVPQEREDDEARGEACQGVNGGGDDCISVETRQTVLIPVKQLVLGMPTVMHFQHLEWQWVDSEGSF